MISERIGKGLGKQALVSRYGRGPRVLTNYMLEEFGVVKELLWKWLWWPYRGRATEPRMQEGVKRVCFMRRKKRWQKNTRQRKTNMTMHASSAGRRRKRKRCRVSDTEESQTSKKGEVVYVIRATRTKGES